MGVPAHDRHRRSRRTGRTVSSTGPLGRRPRRRARGQRGQRRAENGSARHGAGSRGALDHTTGGPSSPVFGHWLRLGHNRRTRLRALSWGPGRLPDNGPHHSDRPQRQRTGARRRGQRPTDGARPDRSRLPQPRGLTLGSRRRRPVLDAGTRSTARPAGTRPLHLPRRTTPPHRTRSPRRLHPRRLHQRLVRRPRRHVRQHDAVRTGGPHRTQRPGHRPQDARRRRREHGVAEAAAARRVLPGGEPGPEAQTVADPGHRPGEHRGHGRDRPPAPSGIPSPESAAGTAPDTAPGTSAGATPATSAGPAPLPPVRRASPSQKPMPLIRLR